MKELLLLRHGKSDWNTDTSDFERSLNKRGKRNTKQIGKWLLENNLQPDLIISSPAKRALSTAQTVSQAMSLPINLIHVDERIYAAEIDDLLKIMSEIPDTVHRLLLVGHNPSMEELLEYLVPEISLPDDGKLMPTATIAYLKMQKNKVTDFLLQRPKDLPL